jgi:plastocyanin
MSSSTHRRPLVALAALGLALTLAACAAATATPEAETAPLSPSAEASPSASPSAEPSPSEAAPSESAEAEAVEVVMMMGSQFVPDELTIAAGTEVTFVNHDSFEHSATEGTGGRAVEDPVVDEDVAVGESATVRFDEPGTYDITCRFHPTMQMTLTVEG